MKQEEAKRAALTMAKIEAAKARVEAQLEGKPVAEIKVEPAQQPELNLNVRLSFPTLFLSFLYHSLTMVKIKAAKARVEAQLENIRIVEV